MRRVGAVVIAALALLAVGLARGAGGGPSLYDGICAPVTYTTLGADPAPLSAAKTVTVGGSDEVSTPETAPQAQIILPAKSFPLPAGSRVTVSIGPIPRPAALPADGSIEGNVYRITAAPAGATSVDLAPGQPATVALEVTAAGGPQLAIERLDGSHWTSLKTVQAGCGTTELANTTRLGAFALVSLGPTSGTGPGVPPPGGGPPWALLAGAGVAAVALLIVVIRLRRSRS